MKKLIFAFLLFLLLSFTGCTSSPPATTDSPSNANDKDLVETKDPGSDESEAPAEPEYIEESELKIMYSNPDKYKGKYVKLVLTLISNAEYDEDGVYFQGFADIQNYDLNTVVMYSDKSLSLSDGDFVSVDGEIIGEDIGYNAFGGEVRSVLILANTAEKISYIDAVSPTIKTFEGTDPQEQHGCSVTIDKVEVSPIETRVYVTVTNNSDDVFNVYDFNAKIIQNGKQYEPSYNYDADYEELQSDILSTVTSSGIITFEKIDETTSFEVIIEGHSDDYLLDFEDYRFEIH